MFIEYPALGDLLPKDYAALSLEGTKYIDMQSVHHSGQDQVHYKCVDFGLRSCCFKVTQLEKNGVFLAGRLPPKRQL